MRARSLDLNCESLRASSTMTGRPVSRTLSASVVADAAVLVRSSFAPHVARDSNDGAPVGGPVGLGVGARRREGVLVEEDKPPSRRW